MGFKTDWASLQLEGNLPFSVCFTLYSRENFKYKPSRGGGGGLYLEGRFNEGFFALRFWGAYIWRGLKPLKKRPLKNISPGAYFRNELH